MKIKVFGSDMEIPIDDEGEKKRTMMHADDALRRKSSTAESREELRATCR